MAISERKNVSDPGGDDLRMTPEAMLALARRASELLVERMERLPGEGAWDGDFQQELEKQLMESPPEEGRPAEEVLERAAREILPLTGRNDHPLLAHLARGAG